MFDYTAEDWELYTSMPESVTIAKRLNLQLEKEIVKIQKKVGKVAVQELAARVRDNMHRLMSTEEFSDVGAADTEPQWAVVDFINKALGTEISRW